MPEEPESQDFQSIAAGAGLSESFEMFAMAYQWYEDALKVGFDESQALAITMMMMQTCMIAAMNQQQGPQDV